MRYCILSTPRSGTTALCDAIKDYLYKHYEDAVIVGELHQFNNATYQKKNENYIFVKENYCTEEHKNIRKIIEHFIEDTDFAIVGKYFPYFWQFEYFHPFDYVDYLIKNGFKLVGIKRNLFDTIISLLVGNHTHHWHSHTIKKKYGTLQPKISEKINLPLSECLAVSSTIKSCYFLVNQISKRYPITFLNYDNFIEESKIKLPCYWDEVTLTTTYAQSYNEIIENYDEVKTWVEDYLNE